MSSKWLLVPAIALLAASLAVFVWVTDAPSYLGKAPQTCNNCHVMDSEYENWFHAPHERWATCSDCHIPHDNFIDYYTDGIVQSNCVRCHIDTVESILTGSQPFDRHCWDCHRTAAHGERGLSLSPYQDSEEYGK
jgi:cytochrome c nitrite reductase small subunit